MPITLGCPSCGKRFRARDESAGKRVKCPYCGAAVSVPMAEESTSAAAATSALPPPPPSGPMKPPAPGSSPLGGGLPDKPPEPTATSTPGDWGFGSGSLPEEPKPLPDQPPPSRSSRLPTPEKPQGSTRLTPAASTATKSPQELAASGWRKTRAGLCWVLFGLFWLSIPGFVGFGKIVYTRATGEDLPEGQGWVEIPGYVNSDASGSIRMTKLEQLDVALYAFPVILAGLCLILGRLIAGAAPRSSGASGLFAWSGILTLLALAGLITAAVADRLLFKETYYYAGLGFLMTGSLAEFWFLTALAASGAALKRPRAPRSVGLVGLVFMLTALVPTVGWKLYYQEFRPKAADLTEDWRLYEQAAIMLGWLLLIGVYWRAVRTVRMAISDFVQKTES